MFVSGLGDLEPVRLSYRNALLHLQVQDVARLSLVKQQPTVRCPLIVAYADGDTAEFQRQTRTVGNYWQDQGLPTHELAISDRCHYQIVLDLVDADSVLFRALARLMALADAAPD
jgi:arylformamidase